MLIAILKSSWRPSCVGLPVDVNRNCLPAHAEGVDEMLAIRSDVPDVTASRLATARLSDVSATMAQWLGVPAPERSGRGALPLVD
jgi:hypothetical protein